MVHHSSKLFYSKISSGFQRQYLNSSYSFRKIENVAGVELSEEMNLVFYWRKISYFVFTYMFLLVSLFISSFHTHTHTHIHTQILYIYIYIYIYIYTYTYIYTHTHTNTHISHYITTYLCV